MFTKNQQQGLSQLGIQVLTLKGSEPLAHTEADSSEAGAPQMAEASGVELNTKQNVKSANRPSLSSLLQTPQVSNQSKQGEVKQQATTNVTNVSHTQKLDWQLVPRSFVTDLKFLFPELIVEGELVKLNGSKTWKLDSGIAGEQIIVDSEARSDLPENLSVADKKKLWQWMSV